MTVEAIAALPVAAVADDDAHLYLWTTNAFLERAFDVARAWDFKPSQMLVWAKTPMGLGPGGAFASSAEFILFARRGALSPLRRWDSTWFHFKRPTVRHARNVSPRHSGKPDGFFDIVEQVSPAPRLEMFARCGRPGWDGWGDEAPSPVELPEVVCV